MKQGEKALASGCAVIFLIIALIFIVGYQGSGEPVGIDEIRTELKDVFLGDGFKIRESSTHSEGGVDFGYVLDTGDKTLVLLNRQMSPLPISVLGDLSLGVVVCGPKIFMLSEGSLTELGSIFEKTSIQNLNTKPAHDVNNFFYICDVKLSDLSSSNFTVSIVEKSSGKSLLQEEFKLK